jgi:hypothetical protein
MPVQLASRAFYEDFTPGTQPKVNAVSFMVTDNESGHVYVAGTVLRRLLGRLPTSNLDQAVQVLASNAEKNGFERAADGFVLSKAYLDSEER